MGTASLGSGTWLPTSSPCDPEAVRRAEGAGSPQGDRASWAAQLLVLPEVLTLEGGEQVMLSFSPLTGDSESRPSLKRKILTP